MSSYLSSLSIDILCLGSRYIRNMRKSHHKSVLDSRASGFWKQAILTYGLQTEALLIFSWDYGYYKRSRQCWPPVQPDAAVDCVLILGMLAEGVCASTLSGSYAQVMCLASCSSFLLDRAGGGKRMLMMAEQPVRRCLGLWYRTVTAQPQPPFSVWASIV